MVGWMRLNSFPSLSGGVRSQVAPRSDVRSMWMRQPLFSVLAPQSNEPSGSVTGLLRTGPTWPSGKRRGFDHELPPVLKDYVARLQQRPAYQRARERTSVSAAPS